MSGREIGWLFGQYKKQTKLWEGVLTGKGGKLHRMSRVRGSPTYKEQVAGEGLSFDQKQLATV